MLFLLPQRLEDMVVVVVVGIPLTIDILSPFLGMFTRSEVELSERA
jgi:hypothetical protein